MKKLIQLTIMFKFKIYFLCSSDNWDNNPEVPDYDTYDYPGNDLYLDDFW